MIITTIGNKHEGKELAKYLVNKRLAACVNIISTVESFYWWNGEIQEENEIMLIIKTNPEIEEKLIEEIKNNHPYDVPAIYQIESTKLIYKPYLDWVIKETSDDL